MPKQKKAWEMMLSDSDCFSLNFRGLEGRVIKKPPFSLIQAKS